VSFFKRIAVLTLLLALVPTQITHAAQAPSGVSVQSDFGSFFEGKRDSYVGAGWESCVTPVTWSFDSSSLSSSESVREQKRIQWALDQWSKYTLLKFEFTGPVETIYSDTDYTLTPKNRNSSAPRHIFFDYVAGSESKLFTGLVYGFGLPSGVDPVRKTIQSGAIVIKQEFMAKYGESSPKLVRSLYLHEIGHVLGLGHASNEANIMHPLVIGNVELGAGDINGVKSLSRACSTESLTAS
jgi:hypothetical protein